MSDLETVILTQKKPWYKKKLTLAISLTGFLAIAFILIYLIILKPNPLLTPLATTLGINHHPTPKPNKIVYGFIPYWNYKYHQEIPYHQLTHLTAFGITFQEDGTIQTREADYQEPGWRSFSTANFSHIQRNTKNAGTKLILTLISFDNDITDSIIFSDENTQTFISQTLNFMEEKNFDGINIDFEYLGNPDQQTKDQFTLFVSKLTQAVKQKNPNHHTSIDVFADSADSNRIWDLKNLAPLVDHVIIMAYDFHRPSSTQAGPVAPLYGAGNNWTEDITSLLAKHILLTPPEKILLGVPYYGYEWRTFSQDFQSSTYKGTGGLATYKRVKQHLQDNPDTQINWDEASLSPWFSYLEEDTDHTYQIYYDDPKSLGLKYDLINQTNLAGTAIWALGYDGGAPEIWNLIDQKFRDNHEQ